MKFSFYFIQQSILPVKMEKAPLSIPCLSLVSGFKIVTEDIVVN